MNCCFGARHSIWPSLDIRVRYEFADVDGNDVSHALTSRERVGLKTTEWNGFSALVEGEFSQAIIDDYNGGAPGADPFDPNNSKWHSPESGSSAVSLRVLFPWLQMRACARAGTGVASRP